jgi:hypothetical protein
VPARGALKHACFVLPEQIQGRKRDSALELKVSAWSPFDDTDYAVEWVENQASVYAWDAAEMRARVQSFGLDVRTVEIVPPAFLQEPERDGVRLVAVPGGYEGQAWKDGLLAMTRWWNRIPTAQEWLLFTRSTGNLSGGTAARSVAPTTVEWLERPWTNSRTNTDLLHLLTQNRNVVNIAAAIALGPFIFLLAQWVTYGIAHEAVQQRLATIEETSIQVRQQRAAALSALDRVEDYMALARFPHQVEIVSAAHAILKDHNITLSNWDYDDGVLEFGMTSEQDMDARIFISAFEDSAMFYQVSASTRGDRLLMRMNVAAARQAAS